MIFKVSKGTVPFAPARDSGDGAT